MKIGLPFPVSTCEKYRLYAAPVPIFDQGVVYFARIREKTETDPEMRKQGGYVPTATVADERSIRARLCVAATDTAGNA